MFISFKRSFQTYNIMCRSIAYRSVHSGERVSVRDFYKDRSVFVTGSTGFIGQCLVEKLLRSCPEIRRIFIPIRATKKGDVDERFENLLHNQVFDVLREGNHNFVRKLIPLTTTLEEPNLGLPDHVLSTLKEDVSVIFHVAALIKFRPQMREAIQSNVQIAANVFRFGKECKNLEAYVHTSTLYLHADLEYVEEKIHPTKWDHNQLIELASRKLVTKRESREIQGSSPAPYFATKKVAEYMTQLEGGSCPVAVVRPGFVTPSLREPFPAWSHGNGSFIPFFNMVESGEARVYFGSDRQQMELIPVDTCSNQLIVTAWYLATQKFRNQNVQQPLVVNQHSSKLKYLNATYFVELMNQCLKDDGRKGKLSFESTGFRLALRVAVPTLVHTILALLRGEKPRVLLLYLFLLFEEGVNTPLVSNNQKRFENLEKIQRCISNDDNKEFPTDLVGIDWQEYIRVWFKTVKEKREALERKEINNC